MSFRRHTIITVVEQKCITYRNADFSKVAYNGVVCKFNCWFVNFTYLFLIPSKSKNVALLSYHYGDDDDNKHYAVVRYNNS